MSQERLAALLDRLRGDAGLEERLKSAEDIDTFVAVGQGGWI